MIVTGSTELKFPFLQASVWGRCDVSTCQNLVQSTLFGLWPPELKKFQLASAVPSLVVLLLFLVYVF